MKLMRAVQVKSPNSSFEQVQKEIPEPKEHEVLLKVEACGICHGDAMTKEGHFPGLTYPRIPGHEVVGVISKFGSESAYWKMGQRVGVGWHAGHCGMCPACLRAEFGACEKAMVTGLSTDGGYAEYMVARMDALNAIPDELSSVEAAPLLCAGRTTFGALKNSAAKAGDLVAIHGFGGLGHLALQFAVKMGFKTAVISRGTAKKALAKKLGANLFFDSTTDEVSRELMKLGGAKLILGLAPNSKEISELIGGLARHGQFILITFANEPLAISPHILMRGERVVSGFTGGFGADALRFSVLTHVVPMVELFPLERAAEAYEKMMTGNVHFRAVLTMGGKHE